MLREIEDRKKGKKRHEREYKKNKDMKIREQADREGGLRTTTLIKLLATVFSPNDYQEKKVSRGRSRAPVINIPRHSISEKWTKCSRRVCRA